MPQLAFLPWATIQEPLTVGEFRIVPYGVAVRTGEIDAGLADATSDILSAYEGHDRSVDRARVPLMHRVGRGVTEDLSDDEVASVFAFREHLAFSALAARDFFGIRYLNSDNLRLVVQRFDPAGSGSTMIIARRRDGSSRNIVSAGRLRESRPIHLGVSCDVNRDVDLVLAAALQASQTLGVDLRDRIGAMVRLFVGTNTDDASTSLHTEIIDTASIFNRLADEWEEDRIVPEFARLLPSPEWDGSERKRGPRASTLVEFATRHSESIRARWLRDLIRVRHPYGHGRILTPAPRALWSEFEHLLLAAVIVPLAVKAFLRERSLYTFTATDIAADRALDGLLLLEPPSPSDGHEDDEDVDEEQRRSRYAERWREVWNIARIWPAIEGMAAIAEHELGEAAVPQTSHQSENTTDDISG
jgi:hypothetical protein